MYFGEFLPHDDISGRLDMWKCEGIYPLQLVILDGYLAIHSITNSPLLSTSQVISSPSECLWLQPPALCKGAILVHDGEVGSLRRWIP